MKHEQERARCEDEMTKVKKFLKDVYKNRILLLMTMPVVIYLILFNYLPMSGIVIAFKDYKYAKGMFGSAWCGLKNFKFLFKSNDLWLLLRNTIGYNVLFILLGTVLAIALAILYDSLGSRRLNRINQTLSILPHFMSFVVVGNFVYIFLSSDKGLLNQLLIKFGMETINWYSEASYWPWILTIVELWMTIGWNSIIYYSNIKGIDLEYYEAAKVDGATWWQQIRYITLPLLKQIIIVMLIMSIGRILNSDFSLFYIIPRNAGALYSVTQTIDTYVYNGLRGQGTLGMTSAVSVFQSVVGFLLVVTVNKIIKKIDEESAMF